MREPVSGPISMRLKHRGHPPGPIAMHYTAFLVMDSVMYPGWCNVWFVLWFLFILFTGRSHFSIPDDAHGPWAGYKTNRDQKACLSAEKSWIKDAPGDALQ